MDSAVKEAGLFRRFVAFIIDLAIVAGVWALLSLLVTSRFLAPALGTDRLEEDRIGYLTDVGLFPIEYGEGGEIAGIDPYYYFNPDPSSDAKEDDNGNAYDELPVGFEYAYEAYFALAYQYVVETLPTYEEDPRFSPVPVPGEEGKLVGELSYYTYLDYFAQEFFGLPSRTEVDYAADDDPTRLRQCLRTSPSISSILPRATSPIWAFTDMRWPWPSEATTIRPKPITRMS